MNEPIAILETQSFQFDVSVPNSSSGMKAKTYDAAMIPAAQASHFSC